MANVIKSESERVCFYGPQRSCEGYVFTPVCHSVHRGGGLPQCMLGYPPPGPHTPGPGTPHLEVTPPSRRLLLLTARILLECILFFKLFLHIFCAAVDMILVYMVRKFQAPILCFLPLYWFQRGQIYIQRPSLISPTLNIK